ncbi:MAG TPA: L-rhamnose isomerase [Verrucomicrobia bacterium]|nr:L-rhamnose isomerase [Verrucomicrobiota bacterium]HCG19379.1 L-rhamnose isomerase [Verrucomicrobiota bacterium]
MSYAEAKKKFAAIGVDTEKAIEELGKIAISMHCWQGDDVGGFENAGGASNGIQTTGNYPGKATTPEQLMADIDFSLSLIPGRHRLNLHACYGVHKDKVVDRDQLGPEQFKPWVEWAKKRGVGLDFNPTFFSHPNVVDGMTLASPDPKIRAFWVKHGIKCLEIADYMAKELKSPCTINFWCPDGYKDEPSDRLGPRQRMADSLDKIFKQAKYDKKRVVPTLESKLFGIGVESYTVNSHEFVMGYALSRKILALLDMGHFHLTENVADKISSFLMFFGKVAFHISRPVRWDSDHVIRQNDDLRNAAEEIVRMGQDNFIIALDYFDASICRVAAWVLGMRNMQKELLKAMLLPNKQLKALQDAGEFTSQLVLQEEYKNYPTDAVWAEFCKRHHVPANEEWLKKVQKYEKDVLLKR